MRVAIVGAGIAGLSCAAALQSGGHRVVLFEKSRGVGGRMATRRVTRPDGDLAFDHGAQYFTARDPAFREAVAGWAAAGVVAPWPAAGEDAWVGTPGMNAVAKALAASLTVRHDHRVAALHRGDDGWLVDADDADRFDAVIVATPAEQAAPLLATIAPVSAALADACRSEPCWTALLAFDEAVGIRQDTIRATGSIGWAARDGAKPGRGGGETWVVQATAAWSRAHLEDAADAVVDLLLAELAGLAERPLPVPSVRIGHRWRYARVASVEHGALWDEATGVGAVGDWLTAPRIESAWLSGRMLAARIGPAAR